MVGTEEDLDDPPAGCLVTALCHGPRHKCLRKALGLYGSIGMHSMLIFSPGHPLHPGQRKDVCIQQTGCQCEIATFLNLTE